VAYGSNTDAGRLATYLSGGRPPGAARHYPGCRDTSPPSGVAAVTIPHERYFALTSRVWGGGIAFVDPAAAPDVATRAVAHRITLGQLADLAAQENGGDPGLVPFPEDFPGPARCMPVVGATAAYDTFLGLDPVDGEPAVTLTAGRRRRPDRVPAPAYLDLVVAGLASHHGVAPDDIRAELAAGHTP
jgi:hypothetical protein